MSDGLFWHIERTINRQVISLTTKLAYYNHLHQLLDLTSKLYQVTVGGLKYTGMFKTWLQVIALKKITRIYSLKEEDLTWLKQKNQEIFITMF